MTPGLILAAGRSARMGSVKALLTLPNGKSFLRNIIDNMRAAGVSKILIAANSDNVESVRNESGADAEVYINPRPEDGMLSSIRIGVSMLGESTAVMVTPVDIPEITAEQFCAVLESGLPNEVSILIPKYDDGRGHPILLSSAAFSLLDEELPSGLRDLLIRYPEKVAEIRIPGSRPLDYDTPGDYERLK